MKNKIIILIIFLLSFNMMKAQPWMDSLKPQQKQNFNEIKKSFDGYWKGKRDSTIKGKGWKQFKRWEWFWGQRTYPDGNFPSPMQSYKERKKFNQLRRQKQGKNLTQSLDAWVSLGPSSNKGGYGGLGRVNCVREHPTNSNIIYAGSSGGGFWLSTDGGNYWKTTTDDLQSIGITDIASDYTNPNIIYIATGDGDAGDTYSIGILKSTDGGLTWNLTGLTWDQNQTRTITRLLIHPTDPKTLFAACSNGIYKTTDGGNTFTQIYTSSIKDMEFKPGNPNVIYIAKTTISRSTDAGVTWTQLSGLPTGAQRIALGVSPADSNYVYALMSGSNSGFLALYQSTDCGTTWVSKSTTPNILGWNSNGSDQGGQGWYDLCIAVSQTNVNEIYCGGVNNWKSTNGGSTWTCVSMWTSTVHADQHDLWFAPNSARLYAGNDGGVYKTTNGGTNWSWIGSGMTITQFYRFGNCASDANLIIGGAQDNGTKLKNSDVWTDVIGGDGMEACIDQKDGNIQYGEIYYGQILKSTNKGSSFNYMNLPLEYSQGLGGWVTPYVLNPLKSSTIYAGYRNVWKSTDAGINWLKLSVFTSGILSVLHVAPSDSNYIYASTGNSYLQRTTDGGTSWTSLQLPCSKSLTYLAIHQSDQLKIWATFSGYNASEKVYYSTNGGSTWTNISGTLPNVPVNCVVYQNDYQNRVYIGNDIGVYYRDDNTSDWVDFSASLPNVVVNELEIHYGTNKLRAATYGRGFWETEIASNIVSLTAPILILPMNNANDISINASLKWTSVEGAPNYTIQYSTNQNFVDPVEITTSDTSIALNNLNYYTKYYWRARSVNGNNISLWSSVNNFTTQTINLSAPALLSPNNNAIALELNQTLSWNSVTNATSYVLQYSKDASFVTFNEMQLLSTSFNVSLDYMTKYYWRVKALNGNNVQSNWSTIWNFTTKDVVLESPELLQPLNDAIGISTNSILKWHSVYLATGYTIRYSTDPSFANYNESPTIDTTYNPSGLLSSAKYYWQVQATNATIKGPWSSIFNFTTTTIVLTAPILTKPVDNILNQVIGTTFYWNKVTNASAYTIQISKYKNFSVFDESSTTSLYYRVAALDYWTTYYWRVKATNGDISGDWSTIWKLTTDSSKLAIPELLLPESGIRDLQKSPWFSWTRVQNASGYKLQISKDFFFNTVYQQLVANDTTVQGNGLPKNTIFYWRVQSTHDATVSNLTAARSMKTINNIDLDPPFLITPINNSTNIDINPFLNWNSIGDATEYNLQYSLTSDFAVNTQITTASNTITLNSLQYSKKYYWRIQAKNSQAISNWSTIWNFTTKQPLLVAPILVSPVNNQSNILISNVIFVWNKTQNATSYRVKYSVNSNFTSPYKELIVSDTTTKITGLISGTKYYWKVQAINGTTSGPWSTVRYFTPVSTPISLTAPVLVSPINNEANVSINPKFTWKSVQNTLSYTLKYSVNSNFTSPYKTVTVTDTVVTVTGLTSGTKYYWKVQAVNGTLTSPWSTVRYFTPVSGVIKKYFKR